MSPGARVTHTAVVGGGILGLTVALRLAQRGDDITVVEAAEDLGGLASAWQVGDITWDRHTTSPLPLTPHGEPCSPSWGSTTRSNG